MIHNDDDSWGCTHMAWSIHVCLFPIYMISFELLCAHPLDVSFSFPPTKKNLKKPFHVPKWLIVKTRGDSARSVVWLVLSTMLVNLIGTSTDPFLALQHAT
jgi:hypothetical protein